MVCGGGRRVDGPVSPFLLRSARNVPAGARPPCPVELFIPRVLRPQERLTLDPPGTRGSRYLAFHGRMSWRSRNRRLLDATPTDGSRQLRPVGPPNDRAIDPRAEVRSGVTCFGGVPTLRSTAGAPVRHCPVGTCARRTPSPCRDRSRALRDFASSVAATSPPLSTVSQSKLLREDDLEHWKTSRIELARNVLCQKDEWSTGTRKRRASGAAGPTAAWCGATGAVLAPAPDGRSESARDHLRHDATNDRPTGRQRTLDPEGSRQDQREARRCSHSD